MTGAEVRTIRMQHGLTQKGFAYKLGYHVNYVRRMENGHEPVTPRFALMVRLLFLTPQPEEKTHGNAV